MKGENAGPSQEWLSRMGEWEDQCPSIAVGGLAADLGLPCSSPGDSRRAFARLIELKRRELRLSVEQLAEQADLDLDEVVAIETGDCAVPQERTVFQLAKTLKLPERRLMEVAGLTRARPEVNQAAIRFAAQSESSARLNDDERRALDEFVKVLVETSDGA